MKNILIVLFCTLVVSGGFVQMSYAETITLDNLDITAPAPTNQGFTPLAAIPGLTDAQSARTALNNGGNFALFFNKLYIYLIGIAVILAVIMIVWGGLEYSTQDSVSKKSDGKSKIYNALFGLVLVLSPVLVFTIINPEILKLNLNIPPLNTKWGSYVAPTTGGVPTTPTDTPNGTPLLPDNKTGPGSFPKYTPCSSATECNTLINTCKASTFYGGANAGKTAYTSSVCLRTDGTEDPNGRTDAGGSGWWWNRINDFGKPTCRAGETVNVTCQILVEGA